MIIPLFFDSRFNNLRLNLEWEDTICENGEDVLNCIVQKSHFKGKNGTYFLNHKNSSNMLKCMNYSNIKLLYQKIIQKIQVKLIKAILFWYYYYI